MKTEKTVLSSDDRSWAAARAVHTWLPVSSEGWHNHPNGGGWVHDAASVAASVHVGPLAVISGGAIYGGARISGGAISGGVIYGGAISGDARISGGAIYGGAIYGGAISGGAIYGGEIYGGAISGGARISGGAIYGDARISGGVISGGVISGGEVVARTPIVILGLPWRVTIGDRYLTIGCQQHTADQWVAFSDAEISEMHCDALEFWRENKVAMLALCRRHQRKETKERKPKNEN